MGADVLVLFNFQKYFGITYHKVRDTRFLRATPKKIKISLHRGMCIQLRLPGVFDAVPAGFHYINPERNVRICANAKMSPSLGERAHHQSTAPPSVVCNLLGCKGKKETNPKPCLVAPH